MKQFKLISLLVCTLLMVGIAGCSDTNEDEPGGTGTSVKVTVYCIADKNNDSPLQVAVSNDQSEDGIFVDPGQTFSKEFEVTELPTTAGFAIFPSIAEENGKCEFTVKGEVALMNGNRVVKKETIDEKVTVSDLENDHTKAYLFEATAEGLKRVTEFKDDNGSGDLDGDSGSSGSEIPTEAENFIKKKISAYHADFTVTHIIDENDYRDKKRRPLNYTHEYEGNVYDIKNYVYPIYDSLNVVNYYYIEQVITASFGESYAGVYSKTFPSDGCNTIGKVCEWYGRSINVTTAPKSGLKVKTHDYSPHTIESKQEVTESVNISITGKAYAGYKNGKAEAAMELGFGYSSNKSVKYVIEDVTVESNAVANKRFGWTYKVNNPPKVKNGPGSTALTDIIEGAAAGRSTLQKTSIFVLELDLKGANLSPESGIFPEVDIYLDVELRSKGGKAGARRGCRKMYVNDHTTIKLPYAHPTEIPDTAGNYYKFEFPENISIEKTITKADKDKYKIEDVKNLEKDF